MRTLALLLIIIVVVAGAALFFYFRTSGIAALNPPNMLETYAATRAKHWLVARAASGSLPPQTPANQENATEGHVQYGSLCAGCHGYDGRTPTKLGNSMNPRVPSLAGRGVQEWSDPELYVIIHDGLRMTGMPGFGNTASSDQVWNLVHYIRTLPAAQH